MSKRNDPVQIRIWKRAWRERNRERLRAYGREYMKKYRAKQKFKGWADSRLCWGSMLSSQHFGVGAGWF